MFNQMELAEQVYKGKSPYKTIVREDANSDSRFRKLKGGEASTPTNPKKG